MKKKLSFLSGGLLLLLLCQSVALAQEQQQIAMETIPSSEDPAIQESLERGLRLYRNRNFEQALKELNRVVEAKSDHADVYYLIGYCHLMQRDFQQSLDAFRRSFAENPNLDPGTIYQRQKNP